MHSGVLRPAEQRRDQCHGGLGVIRATALLEEGGLGHERRIPVHLEQFALDPLHFLRTGAGGLQLTHNFVMRVEVAQVVRRHHVKTIDE